MTENRFFRGHRRRGSYNLFSTYNHFTPGIGKTFTMLALFFIGVLLGTGAIQLMTTTYGPDATIKYGNLISYPLMFIPIMVYGSVVSRIYDHGGKGIPVDNCNLKEYAGWWIFPIASIAILAAAIVIEPIALLLPEPSEEFEIQMKYLMDISPVWVTFITVSIFAPFFEELLCRGFILRGLLTRYHPGIGIFISAAVFALIHMNIWQAVPAFLFGLLFGYIYYKTGSLKLTMLMHSINNTMALVVSRIPALKEHDLLMDAMSPWCYGCLYLLSAVALIVTIYVFYSLPKRTIFFSQD